MAESERRDSTARAGGPKRPARGRTGAAPGAAPAHEGPQAAGPERPAPLCQVTLCPICATVMLLGDAQPELIEHLLAAGREMLLLAMRTIIDSRLQDPPDPPTTIQRLTIT